MLLGGGDSGAASGWRGEVEGERPLRSVVGGRTGEVEGEGDQDLKRGAAGGYKAAGRFKAAGRDTLDVGRGEGG